MNVRQDTRRDADNKERNVIHICANEGCGRKVPNCAVCLRPMDMLNPLLEYKRQQSKSVNNFQSFGIGLDLGMNLNMGGLGGIGAPAQTQGLGSQISLNSGGAPGQRNNMMMPTSMSMGLGVGALGMPPSSTAPGNTAGRMNTNLTNSLQIENIGLDIKQNQSIGNWMTWCQTCKHGGHA